MYPMMTPAVPVAAPGRVSEEKHVERHECPGSEMSSPSGTSGPASNGQASRLNNEAYGIVGEWTRGELSLPCSFLFPKRASR